MASDVATVYMTCMAFSKAGLLVILCVAYLCTMLKEKWLQLNYDLVSRGRTRSMEIKPFFQKVPGGWFDTGQYTIIEAGKPLGNLYVDVYTAGPLHWDGSKDEFDAGELEAIANFIQRR